MFLNVSLQVALAMKTAKKPTRFDIKEIQFNTFQMYDESTLKGHLLIWSPIIKRGIGSFSGW